MGSREFPLPNGGLNEREKAAVPSELKLQAKAANDEGLGNDYPDRVGMGTELPLPEISLTDGEKLDAKIAQAFQSKNAVPTEDVKEEVLVDADRPGAPLEDQDSEAEHKLIQAQRIGKLSEALKLQAHLLRANPRNAETQAGRDLGEEIGGGIELLVERALERGTNTKEKLSALIDLQADMERLIPNFGSTVAAEMVAQRIHDMSEQGHTESGFKVKGLTEEDLQIMDTVKEVLRASKNITVGAYRDKALLVATEARALLTKLQWNQETGESNIRQQLALENALVELELAIKDSTDPTMLHRTKVTVQGTPTQPSSAKNKDEEKAWDHPSYNA